MSATAGLGRAELDQLFLRCRFEVARRSLTTAIIPSAPS
jgi:hypothetical protein